MTTDTFPSYIGSNGAIVANGKVFRYLAFYFCRMSLSIKTNCVSMMNYQKNS